MLLRAGAQESINVKGAYLEVVADAAGSAGVILAGIEHATLQVEVNPARECREATS